MKEFNNFVNEIQEVESLEDLEFGRDLFDDGVNKGNYNMDQIGIFNDEYWKMKNKLITDDVYNNSNKRYNYLQLHNIIRYAKSDIKQDREKLKVYINNRLKALKGKVRI